MSGKRQKVVSGWFDCSKCKRRFSRQLMAKHSGDEESGCRVVYPNLKNGALICTLTNVTPLCKKIGELPFIRDKRLSSSTIFVSEELIKEYGLTTFGWVSLTSLAELGRTRETTPKKDVPNVSLSVADIPSSNYAFRVWPIPESIGSNQCNLLTVLTIEGFSVNRLYSSTSKVEDVGDIPNGLVRVQKLSSSLSPVFPSAAEITLQIENAGEVDSLSFSVDRFANSFRRIFQGRPIAINNRFKIRFYAQTIQCGVCKLEGNNTGKDETLGLGNLSLDEQNVPTDSFLQIVSTTIIHVKMGQSNLNISPSISHTLKDIGGLSSVLNEICSTVKFILNTTLDVPKVILLYGHPGVGKSFVAQAVAKEFNLFPIFYEEFKSVNPSIRNDNSSSYHTSLEKVFKESLTRSPSVIIVDALDVVCPKKSTEVGSVPMTSFTANFSRLASAQHWKHSKVVIVCCATDLERLDPNIRSPKIFAKEIEIPVPTILQREEILAAILSHMNHSLTADDINVVASNTHGFVAADLRALCNQASLDAASNKTDLNLRAPVSMLNIQECIKSIKPSAIKSILIDVPNVKWGDIGGQDELKFKLKQAIEWPLKHPESFKRLGITPPKGVLMYGPPGCSKTMIAKAIATESGLNFISVKGSELFSKWVGESEKAVQGIFRKARQVAPCVIFFDEIDSLGGERGTSSGSSNVHERVLAQILVEIDGIEALKDVTIVAATNRPDRIDQALLRPGRLDRIIYVPLPDAKTRTEILKIRFNKMPIDPEVNIDELVQCTDCYSGAELTALCHEAALKSLEEDISSENIKASHFKEALGIVKPRISQEQIDFYENYYKSRSQ